MTNEIVVFGQVDTFAPGSTASFFVFVHLPYRDTIQASQPVTVSLSSHDTEPQIIYTTITDDRGLAEVSFPVPKGLKEPQQVLTISANTRDNGRVKQVTRSFETYIGQVDNILLSTDKPVYQPGQTIHIRALALSASSLKAAQNQVLELTVADPQGNKLARQTLTTSAYGVASSDFVLSSEAASGDYILSAEMGDSETTRSVEVKPYTLPRFKVEFSSDQPYYKPGAQASGVVSANYFFGKPVAGAGVTIRGFVTDVERAQAFEIKGEVDQDGHYAYEFAVPDYFATTLDNDTANIDLEISVVDASNHQERIDESVTVSAKPILIHAVAESGTLRPGIPNMIYVDAAYPDGSAAPVTLEIAFSGQHILAQQQRQVVDNLVHTFDSSGSGQNALDQVTAPLTLTTDAYGLGVFTITPTSSLPVGLIITATDAAGVVSAQPLILRAETDPMTILLRPDRAAYAVGDTMKLDILVTDKSAPTVYLDVAKGGQSFAAVALPLVEQRAYAAIPIDGDLLGTLQLRAYAMTQDGRVSVDRRLVLVEPAPATVDVQTDAAVYKPGDTATLTLQVTRDGAPMPGVVGVSIVDESVFSIGTQDPGFARTYFLLDRELQEPRYDIHGFTPLESDDPSPYDQRAQRAHQLALAGFFAEELAAWQQPSPLAVTVPPSPLAPLAPFAARVPFALPLLGLAFYDGSVKRRRLLFALIALGLLAFIAVSCAPAAPAAMPAAEAPAAAPAVEATTATRGQSAPPRLRQFFPETLFWLPEAATDAQGHVQIDVPIADSITTWRISVIASDENGNLGSAEAGLRVFQDFFIEPDLPRFLTVGDELQAPVSIFNYLDQAQTIKLSVKPAEWFEFTDASQLTVDVGPNEVAAAYIPIRVTGFGRNTLEITAIGSQMSDAIRREVEVLPNGQRQAMVQNGTLETEKSVVATVPSQAIQGASRVTVKIYPGVVSQLVEGMDALLQQPYGCFEQTSSTTYPNVMVLNYLKTTGQISPKVQMAAEAYIQQGYQRLLSFEVPGEPGGFSLFGDAPAQLMLTAYGLMEFTDMSEVAYVDPALLERTAQFIFAQQEADGSWSPWGQTIESGSASESDDRLVATAYIVWALADAGYADRPEVQAAVTYLQAQIGLETASSTGASTGGKAPPAPKGAAAAQPTTSKQLDAYPLALIANALIAANQDAGPLLEQLAAMTTSNGSAMQLNTGQSTWMSSRGVWADFETTALATHAFLRAGSHTALAQGGVNFMTASRDFRGAFGTTQATILALKTLLLAEKGALAGETTVTVQAGAEEGQPIVINEQNADLVHAVSFDAIVSGDTTISLTADGDYPFQVQVITEYYLPWSEITKSAQPAPLRIDVSYDRTELQVNDTVGVHATVELLTPGVANTVLVDLGVPPGFSPVASDLYGLVDRGVIARYELTGRQIIIYLTDVESGKAVELDYRLQARFPINAQTPASQAYEYYSPDNQSTVEPQRIVVRLGATGD